MSDTVSDGKELLKGVEQDALQQAQTIVREALQSVEDKKLLLNSQIRTIEQQSEAATHEHIGLLKKNTESATQLELRRLAREEQRALVAMIIKQVEEQLHSLINTSSYRQVLLNWTIEACMGLESIHMDVNASQEEKSYIDKGFCVDVQKIISEKYKRTIVLTCSTGVPLLGQGIEVTALDGKTAFNNQVKTRMLRLKQSINSIIYSQVFSKKEVDIGNE